MPSGSVGLAGKITDGGGSPKVGLTVSLYEAATWEAAGAATTTDTSDSDGLWNFDAQDITKTWIVVAADGTKKVLIDARNKIQLTNIDLIDDLSVDTIYEHTAANGVSIDSVTLKDGLVQAGNGAVGGPSLTFLNSLTTGFYRTGADVIGIAVAGALDIEFAANLLDLKDGTILELNEQMRWDTAGAATTAGAYQFGRDDSTVLHANVPTGATFEWSVNDVAEMTLSATTLDLQSNAITTSGAGTFTGGVTSGAAVVSDTANTDDLGTDAVPWRTLYVGTSVVFDQTTRNVTITASEPATAARTYTIPDFGANDSFVALAASQELTNKTLASSVGKGTWTASGTWTLPAITLGGAVAGGDQAFTGVGDMTFTAGSILAAAVADTSTLLIKAGGLTGTTVITVTSNPTDTLELANVTSFVAGGNLDIGAYDFRAATITADGLTSGRVVFAGTNGVLSDDADFTFATDTLTVTKIAAFEATGAINFGNQNMTNVDIDSGAIDGTTIGAASAANGTFAAIVGTGLTITSEMIQTAGAWAFQKEYTISTTADDLILSPAGATRVSGNFEIGGATYLGRITSTRTASISAAAAILEAEGFSNFCLIQGRDQDGANEFFDVVMASRSVNPSVIKTYNSQGSPQARTYSRSGNDLRLAMADGTYDIHVLSFTGIPV